MGRVIRVGLFLGLVAGVAATALGRAASASLTAEDPSPPQILLSRQLMEQAGVRVGDVVTLAADAEGSGARRFRVVAKYEPTPNPLTFSARRIEARLHLPDLMALTADPADPMSVESVSALHLAMAGSTTVAAVRSGLMARSPGLYLVATSSERNEGELFAVIERFHQAIAVVTVVGSTAFLLALMVIRAEERRDIIGILRLMGIPPRSILAEVLLEGLLIAIVGAVFGIIVAVLGQSMVNRFFQWRYDTTLTFVRVTLPIAYQSVALAVPLGVIAGLAASWTLLRRDIVSLVRR